MAVLGLDTSAYTTSLALVDEEERLIWEKRLPLPVKAGGLGLRQSEAVFQHLRNLPALMAEGAVHTARDPVTAVAAAVRPCPAAGSYMPVFTVAETFGTFLAHSAGLFFYPTSHQEGHIAAGLWSAGLGAGRYLALHLSGGTTDILEVEEAPPGNLYIRRLGGGSDLNAGQFIDRIGVALGLPFPAGPALERLAGTGKTGAMRLPVAVQGTAISFSGPDTHARRLLQGGCSGPDLSRAVEVCIADSLVRAAGAAVDMASENGMGAAAEAGAGRYRAVLVVGGVAANAFIRRRLAEGLSARAAGITVAFASPVYAGDSAVGVAVQAARKLKGKKPGSASGT